jgi:hypothetical protein
LFALVLHPPGDVVNGTGAPLPKAFIRPRLNVEQASGAAPLHAIAMPSVVNRQMHEAQARGDQLLGRRQ